MAPGKNEKTKKRKNEKTKKRKNKKKIFFLKNGQGIEKYQKMVREGALPTDGLTD